MAIVIKPAMPIPATTATVVFLAGSIEMGRAEPWQARVEEALADRPNLIVLNPRRDDWDESWIQSVENPEFRGQVEWELAGMERADLVVMYLAPDTRAPVSLLELGLCARTGKLIVCCPEGYWRKGNVDVVCRRYGVAQVEHLEGLIAAIRAR